LKDKEYTSWVKSCVIYGRETEHEAALDRYGVSMPRLMCDVNLKDRKENTEIRKLLGLEPHAVEPIGGA